jgi:ABC-type transporter Mla MlaB component
VEIDLRDVSEIDSAGVQLLLLVEREAAAVRRELRLVSPSAAVREVLTLLNLQTRLAMPCA